MSFYESAAITPVFGLCIAISSGTPRMVCLCRLRRGWTSWKSSSRLSTVQAASPSEGDSAQRVDDCGYSSGRQKDIKALRFRNVHMPPVHTLAQVLFVDISPPASQAPKPVDVMTNGIRQYLTDGSVSRDPAPADGPAVKTAPYPTRWRRTPNRGMHDVSIDPALRRCRRCQLQGPRCISLHRNLCDSWELPFSHASSQSLSASARVLSPPPM